MITKLPKPNTHSLQQHGKGIESSPNPWVCNGAVLIVVSNTVAKKSELKQKPQQRFIEPAWHLVIGVAVLHAWQGKGQPQTTLEVKPRLYNVKVFAERNAKLDTLRKVQRFAPLAYLSCLTLSTRAPCATVFFQSASCTKVKME